MNELKTRLHEYTFEELKEGYLKYNDLLPEQELECSNKKEMIECIMVDLESNISDPAWQEKEGIRTLGDFIEKYL